MSDSYGVAPGTGNEPGLPPINLPSFGGPPQAPPQSQPLQVTVHPKPPAVNRADGAAAAAMPEYVPQAAPAAAADAEDGAAVTAMPEYVPNPDTAPLPEPGPVDRLGARLAAPGFVDRVKNLWEHPPAGPSIVGDILKPLWSAATLPGDVQAGKVDPMSDAGIGRAWEAAKVLSPINPAIRAGDLAIPGVRTRASPEAQAAISPAAAAQRQGIALPSAIANPSPFTRILGQVVSKAPGGSVLSRAIENASNQTEGAVTRTASALGAANPAEAGAAFSQGIQTGFKPAIKKVVGDAYDRVDALVDPNVTTPLTATTKAVSDIMAERQAGAMDPYSSAVKLVSEGVTRPEGLSYTGIKSLRSSIGEMIDTGTFPEGMSQTELRRLYKGLTADLKNSVAQAGGKDAANAFNYANTLAKNAAAWKDSIAKVLGPESRSSEGIAATITRMAGKGPTADIETLLRARTAVPKSAWAEVASNALARLGRDKAGNFSPPRFFSDYGNLSKEGKAALFGGAGSDNLLPFLDEIHRVSKAFSEAGKLANVSGTSSHNVAAAALGAVAAGVAHLSWVEPVTAVTAAVGAYGTARILARPATAAAMARWARASLAFKQRPGAIAGTAMIRASIDLSRTARSYGINVSPKELLNATQGTQPVRADQQPTK
jgi:hypothetical protein